MEQTLTKMPKFSRVFNLSIGAVGMLLATYANLLTPNLTQKWCYFIAALALLVSSVLERHKFFAILQIIVVAATAIAFTSFSLWTKAALPVSLSILSIVYFIYTGECKDRLTAFGCLGILLLAIGYATINPIAFLFGALVLMIYSYTSFQRGVTIALLWAILNAMFSITASIAIYHYLQDIKLFG